MQLAALCPIAKMCNQYARLDPSFFMMQVQKLWLLHTQWGAGSAYTEMLQVLEAQIPYSQPPVQRHQWLQDMLNAATLYVAHFALAPSQDIWEFEDGLQALKVPIPDGDGAARVFAYPQCTVNDVLQRLTAVHGNLLAKSFQFSAHGQLLCGGQRISRALPSTLWTAKTYNASCGAASTPITFVHEGVSRVSVVVDVELSDPVGSALHMLSARMSIPMQVRHAICSTVVAAIHYWIHQFALTTRALHAVP